MSNVDMADSIQSSRRKPSGFDLGLICLMGVFVWTIAVKYLLEFVNHTHNPALIFVAMILDCSILFILLLASLCLLVFRKRLLQPPRVWALSIAILWVVAQLAVYVQPHNYGRAIDRKTFSLYLPGHWTENTNDDMYDPNSLIVFEGPGSAVFCVIIGQKSTGASVDTLVAKQRDIYAAKLKDATVTEITKWAGYDGRGFKIEGKIQGIVKERLTVFGFENGDNICVITESATIGDYEQYAVDFEELRQRFKLK